MPAPLSSIVFLSISFTAGSVFALVSEEHLFVFAVIPALLSAVLAFLIPKKTARLLLMILCAYFLGVFNTSTKLRHTFKAALTEKHVKGSRNFTAVIKGYEGLNLNKHSYIAEVNNYRRADGKLIEAHAKIRLYIYSKGSLLPGDFIYFKAKLKPYSTIFNSSDPEGRRILRVLKNKRLFATATVYRDRELQLLKRAPFFMRTFYRTVYRLRSAIAQRLAKVLDGRNRAFALCLTIADKDSISNETRKTFSRAGVSHTLAVSGLHLGMLVLIIAFLLRPFALTIQQRTAISVIISFAVYAPLSLFSPSLMRAGIMGIFAAAAFLRGGQNSAVNAVFSALFVLAFFNPAALLGPSLQLSFAAVSAIVIITPAVDTFLGRRLSAIKGLPLLRGLLDTIAASASAMLFTAPFSLYHFGSFSGLAVISNIYAVPITFLLLLSSILSVVLAPFDYLAEIIGAYVEFCVLILQKCNAFLTQHLPLYVEGAELGAFAALIIFCVLLGAALFLNTLAAKEGLLKRKKEG